MAASTRMRPVTRPLPAAIGQPRARVTSGWADGAARPARDAAPLHDFADHRAERLDVALGGGRAECETQRPARPACRRPSRAARDWAGPLPAVHAEPVEQAMPLASSSISRASPSQPGNEKCALPGSRRRAGRGAVEDGVGHGREHARDQVVAERGQPGHFLVAALDGDLGSGGERPDGRGVQGARTARPAPGHRRASPAPARLPWPAATRPPRPARRSYGRKW